MAQMIETATAGWTTWQQALAVVRSPRSLKRSAAIATVVGTVFFAMNQLPFILAGHAGAAIWVKAALTYLTPLAVSNIGMLSATRAPTIQPAATTGEES
jgi:hypothetical protein